ncbi:DUF4871 domain-containing protein [Fictibacillus halophilus]|uniref:DUF4871 domain-containing protein n=1 Tax=Fictibacillus halophilus TaxID=1610490 RepID=UPI001CFB69F8|nr:DUF4871 domain-containing protein [Fictibacillus halophilus]
MKKIIVALFILLLTACTQNEWNESPVFESGSYKMIGEKNKIGFIYDPDVERIYLKKETKYMWHVWGKDVANQNLRVEGISENDSEPLHLFEAKLSGTPHNGADAVTPSSISLPKPGIWKLDAYVDEKLFGTVYINVHKK